MLRGFEIFPKCFGIVNSVAHYIRFFEMTGLGGSGGAWELLLRQSMSFRTDVRNLSYFEAIIGNCFECFVRKRSSRNTSGGRDFLEMLRDCELSRYFQVAGSGLRLTESIQQCFGSQRFLSRSVPSLLRNDSVWGLGGAYGGVNSGAQFFCLLEMTCLDPGLSFPRREVVRHKSMSFRTNVRNLSYFGAMIRILFI